MSLLLVNFNLIKKNIFFINDHLKKAKPTGTSSSGPFEEPVCIIPWHQISNFYYFCNPSFLCMPYQPDSNATRNCQRGITFNKNIYYNNF